MKLIKKILWLALVVTIVTGGLVVAANRGVIQPNQLATFFTPPQLTPASQDAGRQFKILSDRSGEVGSQVQKVLGEFIQVNQQDKQPLSEKTLEYAQYLYCQQVVQKYQTTN